MSINATLLGQMITFLLFVWFTKQYVWPPLTKALDERKAKIADGLAAAERGHHDLELAQQTVSKQLKTSKTEASTIIANAKAQANQIIEQAKGQARLEGERLVDKAQEEIKQMVTQAEESLKTKVASIAILGAERVLEATVDQSAHEAMLNRLVEEI